jgi:hypothetical protein
MKVDWERSVANFNTMPRGAAEIYNSLFFNTGFNKKGGEPR